ncbi:hypothetical protein MUK42_11059 [Musa troglodytarum]|uniref:Uncharacterized protein n=1 Tax=Musa troglodytarum TaxID=320322 RepID=A0A9E7GLM1_9LILI|nr:hypothetical protein MUK42_11059 [Musa troglodytarum]
MLSLSFSLNFLFSSVGIGGRRAVLFFHSPLPVAFVVPFISRGRRAASSPASKLHALKKEAPALVRLTLLPLLLSLDRRRKSAPDAGLIGKVGS